MRSYFWLLLCVAQVSVLSAQTVTVKVDNGSYSTHYATTNRPLWEETVMLQPKGPCRVTKLYIYLVGTAAVQDTIWLMGDASEGFTPPSHYVWDHDLLTDPVPFQFHGKTGWDTIDISDRNVRSDGYDRIVVMHRLRTGSPTIGYTKGALASPISSFLYDPWTPNTSFLNIPGILYLPNGNFMARLGVQYDFPVADSSAPPPVPTLVDRTKLVGLLKDSAIIQADRVSVADWNGDGWDDIAIGSLFFQNNGDGTFRDVSSTINIAASATVWGDFDNDGKLDVYAINGGANDKLYHNNGDGTFTDVTAVSGFSNPNPTITPIWFDYDRDGWIDLYISNGRTSDAKGNETYYPDQLWHNNGNGTFTNTTDASLISDAEPPPYYDCWGASPCDYDRDGWPDIFVANYRLAPDFLFHNLHDGTFEEVGHATGVEGVPTTVATYFGHGIGCDWGDFNNDGSIDLAVGNLGHPDERGLFSNASLIFRNGGGPNFTFTDVHKEMGLKFREMNAGIIWLDLNNDGYLDLWHCQYSYNNAGDTSAAPLVEQYRPSRMYINEGPDSNFRLHDATWALGSLIHGSWTAARGDFDRDGRVDIVAASGKKNEGVKFFKNNLANTGNWVEIKLTGDPNHKVSMDAYGTSITAHVGGMKIYRELMGGGSGSTGTQNSNTYHFGLGTATQIDSLVIRYPNDRHRTMYAVAANTFYQIPYEEAKNDVRVAASSSGFDMHVVSVGPTAVEAAVNLPEGAHELTLSVIDLLGHTVTTRQYNAQRSTTFLLPLHETLPSGVYFLQVRYEGGTAMKRFSYFQ